MKFKSALSFILIVIICISTVTISNAAVLSNSYSMLWLDSYAEYIKSSNQTNEITVAVIDTGCADIEILGDKLIAGYDFVDMDNDVTNDKSSDSHGTFIASIIADITDELPVKIMPVRILENKNVSADNLIKGIKYAVDNGADILNISIGGTLTDCTEINNAVAYAEENDVTVVVSAGNAKKEITNFCPSHIESCITVSAVDDNRNFAKKYSNYGDAVDCCAFGNNIAGYNADGELTTLSGTSFSAALISAGCALLKLDNPEYSAQQVQNTIKSICIDLGDEGKDKYYGYGLPDFNMLIPFTAEIINYSETQKIDYLSTFILHAENNIPFDSTIDWYVNGQYYSTGDTFEMGNIRENFDVYFTVSDNYGYVIQSKTESIMVKSRFFDRFIAFFRNLFGILPTWIDNVKQ